MFLVGKIKETKNFIRILMKYLKLNSEIEGSLFIIRDIKTFNIYAAEIFKGIPRNYYIILLNGVVRKEDIIPVENITNDNGIFMARFFRYAC